MANKTDSIMIKEKHLIYISHSENDALVNEIIAFKKELEIQIRRKTALNSENLIWDKTQIKGNMHIDIVKRILESSEFFLFVYSPSYYKEISSPNHGIPGCIEELNTFIEQCSQKVCIRIFKLKITHDKIRYPALDYVEDYMCEYDLCDEKEMLFFDHHQKELSITINNIALKIKENLDKAKLFIGVILTSTKDENAINSMNKLTFVFCRIKFSLELIDWDSDCKLVFEGYSKDIQAAIKEFDASKKIKNHDLLEIIPLETESDTDNFLSR